MKIIIAGSRGYTNYEHIKGVLVAMGIHLIPDVEIVSGGAKGVDRCGEMFAAEFKLPLKLFLADWIIHGNSAGPIRNGQMARYADKLIVFWDGKSKGTANMVHQMKGLKGVENITHNII